jgi:cell division protein FtsI (penicillin-binding protein 3)
VKRPPTLRLVVLFVAFLVALGGIVVRLAVLQVRQTHTYAALGLQQRIRTEDLPANRGTIVDRNLVPLAMTLEASDVYANPALVTDPVREAAAIASALDMKAQAVRAALESHGTFVYVARQVDRDAAQRVAALHLPGIGLVPIPKRYYPAQALAPQVLGFVGVDGTGLSGLEEEYQSLLAGQPGEQTVELSAQGQEIAGGEGLVRDPLRGSDLVLTIDREIQFQAQTYLRQAVRQNHAKGGTVIVLDPRTGDVYAMATYPWFDPNRFARAGSATLRNRAVTDTWEPGSVNKIITAATALETGSVGLQERFDVPSTRKIEGFTIHDSESHPIESMTLADIIAHSSNIGISLVADRVGSDALASYFSKFGYGVPTGVGFPGEAAGLMPQLTNWTDLTRATVSFGAGVAVTPLQMASVYATIANGGTWIQPRLVRSVRAPDGSVKEADASPTRRVLRPSTAKVLAQMLAYAVQDGTGEAAQIPGYQVAGKTGTAKKLDHNGHYTNRYVASFIGFLPASAPRLVVATIIDEPQTVYGGVAAAPLFQEVARAAIQRLGIRPAPPVKLPPHALPLP